MTIDLAGVRSKDNYTGVIIFNPDGTWRRSEVLKGREMSVQQARDGLEAGQTVWVTLDDAQLVGWQGKQGQ